MPKTKNLDPWRVEDSNFPHMAPLSEKIAFCLRYAILAPSTYNTQPWYFSINEDTVSLYCDRRLALPVIDPDDRQMILSCAAALFNLRLALRYFGFEETTQLLPNAADEDLLARVQVKDSRRVTDEEDKALFKAITERRHNRSPYSNKPVDRETLKTLQKAAEREGAFLYLCEDDERAIVAHMIAEGDHMQMNNKAFRRELAAWTNTRRFLSGDGFPQYARQYSEMMQSSKPRISRRFESEPGIVVKDEDIAEGCPALAILCSERGGNVNRLYTGQAYMRLALTAQTLGLSMSTLNQPCEVPDLRLRLQDEIEHFRGRAHYVIRLGYAEPNINASPRRPLESFMEHEESREPLDKSAEDKLKKSRKKNFWNNILPFGKK